MTLVSSRNDTDACRDIPLDNCYTNKRPDCPIGRQFGPLTCQPGSEDNSWTPFEQCLLTSRRDETDSPDASPSSYAIQQAIASTGYLPDVLKIARDVDSLRFASA
jgi:hypothetical protein